MSNCASCQKLVYPTEQLLCLDKVWHQRCFKCCECGRPLNMKTYKGFEKRPYCISHVPKLTATVLAETPEIKRIVMNTKLQSTAQYHADFEKSKGKFTQVTDDPESLRLKETSRRISNLAYQKKADMERLRSISCEQSKTDIQNALDATDEQDAPRSVKSIIAKFKHSDCPAEESAAEVSVQLENKKSLHTMYRALYKYDAQDNDEVSILENDIIFGSDAAENGWLFGKVERTGKVGLLPANYVEIVSNCSSTLKQ